MIANTQKMATIKLILDQRRENKDNTYPLVFRIYALGRTRDPATGIKITEQQFNSKSGEIVDDYITNNNLQSLKIEYLQKLNLYTLKNKGVENAQGFRNKIFRITQLFSMGHNYGNSTTSHYLEQFHQDELDDLTMKVIKTVTSI